MVVVGRGSPAAVEGTAGGQAGSFAVGRNAISEAEFAAFVAATRRVEPAACRGHAAGRPPAVAGPVWPGAARRPRADAPMTCVSVADAVAYAAWLADRTGRPYRLPSGAELGRAAELRIPRVRGQAAAVLRSSGVAEWTGDCAGSEPAGNALAPAAACARHRLRGPAAAVPPGGDPAPAPVTEGADVRAATLGFRVACDL